MDNPGDHHRHVSHLYALYPSAQITPETPELFNAARVSLEKRGDISTGWAMGWRVCLWARLLDGDHAFKLIQNQLSPLGKVAGGGGTYAVLAFDQETQVTGESADGSGQRTQAAKMLGIAEHTDYSSFVVEYGDLNLFKTLDGKQVTLAAKAGDIMFPSDVRLPIGEPQAKQTVVLS